MKDEEILALSLERPSVFEELFDRYQAGFLRTALRILKNREEAEDVVQESFTKIYINAKKFRKMEGASFKSWAYKILINVSFTKYQKLKKKNALTYNFFESNDFYEEIADLNGGNADSGADMKNAIEEVLKEMPAHLAESLKSHYLDDRSQKEMAKEENISLTSVKMRLFRARKAFKKIADSRKNLSWIM